jgi:hypothetical protein
MKTKMTITMLVGVAMILSTPIVTLGAPGGNPGPPSGGGGAGDAAGALYGDLYVIERAGDGEPVTREVTYTDSETGQPVTVNCLQPLAGDCGLLPFWGECGLETMPTGVLPLPACVFDPEAYDPCAVYDSTSDPAFYYAGQLQTVSFGRESVSRASATVIDSSYAEALNSINLAVSECGGNPIKKDPAGRIMLCLATETDPVTYAWKTIDAPLENLGLYRAVMTNGCFGPIDEEKVGEEGVPITVTTALSGSAKGNLNSASLGHLVCADDTNLPEGITKPDMLSAAVFIAAGADKTSPISLDEIINVNTYLGVNSYTYQRSGKNRILTVDYFQFKDPDQDPSGNLNGWFAYKRGVDACVPGTEAYLLNNTGDGSYSPKTTNVFGDVFDADPPGPGVDLRGPNGVPITVCRGGLSLDEFCDDPDSNSVYGPEITDIGCGGANWFAQAAEDARKTIWYLHNYEVPELAY